MTTVLLCYLTGAFAALCIWTSEEGTDLLYSLHRRKQVWSAWGVVLVGSLLWPGGIYFGARNIISALRRQRAPKSERKNVG